MERCNPGFETEVVVGNSQQVIPDVPAIPTNQFFTVIAGEFRLEEPVAIATHFSSFEQGDWFYFAGIPAVPGDVVNVPVLERVQLCNVVDQFSRRQAEGIDLPTPVPTAQSLFEIYPTLARMSTGENWQLLLETDTGVTVLSPVTLFWTDELGRRFTSVDLEQGRDRLLLEFVFQSSQPTTLRSANLILKEAPDESLAAQLSESAIQGKLFQINQWLSFYSRTELPFVINGQGIAQIVTESNTLPSQVSTSSGQLRLIHACLQAYLTTNLAQYRERSLTLTEALLNYFYPEPIPIDTQTLWAPHWLVNAGDSFAGQGPVAPQPNNYGAFDVAIEFFNGVGQLPENIAEVYKVYTGELTWVNASAELAEGKSYAIDYWVDADSQQRFPNSQEEEDVQTEGSIFYVTSQETQFVSPTYSAFILGVY
ncbi:MULTISPECIES: hypothetical protein [Trichocoleus]|uniref:Uncharacterized protein n=1 Tax=Trichocoleus desertorum GB2-A4 TaxID=2933944 RepID=A0ABV0JCK2_9CYAN|nr:hypothetical protein [Trichocoleus sp. FACHB-46]MBD1864174.1 hypothetical protein [Trichocoleus sp. FACHB-46]